MTGHAAYGEMLPRRVLPEPATPLLGRGTEVVATKQALTSGSVRLLTLTGPGGVGKTHLALEIGRTLASNFANGAYWVDLAPLNVAELVLPTLARTLGLTDPGQMPVREQVQIYLQARHVLLILDNFERSRGSRGHWLPAEPMPGRPHSGDKPRAAARELGSSRFRRFQSRRAPRLGVHSTGARIRRSPCS
jgi:hypothetical protein